MTVADWHILPPVDRGTWGVAIDRHWRLGWMFSPACSGLSPVTPWGVMDGRRKSRTQVALVARYRSPTVFEFVEEQCFDLSEGGMFIKSKAPAPSGTLLKIECQVAEGPDTITAVARVVWLRETENAEGPRGMGVKFVKLENGSADVIARVLARASQSLPPAAPTPSAPPPSRSAPPPAVVETPLPAALASTVLAMDAPKVPAQAAPSTTASTAPAKAEPATPTATPAATPPKTATAATAAAGGAKPASPSAPATPEPGFPTAAWVIAGIVIVVIVVIATSGGKEPPPTPRVIAPAAAASPQPMPTPAPEATPEPTPEPTPAPPAPIEPVAATPAAVAEPTPTAPVVEAAPTSAAPAVPPPSPEPVAAPASTEVAPAPAATRASGYVVSVVSTPRGASITANEQTCTSPCTLRFTDLGTPIKINAAKARHHPTAATITAQDAFTERDGALHRTLYLKLHPEAAAEEPAAAPSPSAPEAPAEPQ